MMVWCFLWALVAQVVGCGSAHVTGADGGPGGSRDGGGIAVDDDGSVTVLPDGRVIRPGDDGGSGALADGALAADGASTGVDGGRGPRHDGHIGTACTSEADCDGRFCSTASSGLGYCSWVCADDVPCPDDAVCVEFSATAGYGYCLAPCGAGSSGACPSGTVCTSGFGLPEPVCLAGCEDDSECPVGTECGTGLGGVGRCFTPDAENGQPCTDNTECSETAFCADEVAWGFAAGICLRFGCSPATGAGCDDGTVCVEFDDGGLCLPSCETDTDCRDGYQCIPSPVADVNACVPRCSRHDQCTDGRRCDFLTGRCFTPS